MNNTPVICTIVSCNYISYARVLTESFLRLHKNGKVFVLLVDKLSSPDLVKNDKFTLVTLDQIGIPHPSQFFFKYTILELNTAVKPYLLEYLFSYYKLKNLFYFDPDIVVFNSLDNLLKITKKSSIVLVPHILKEIKDNKRPSEIDVLLSGVYNLGFIALNGTSETNKVIKWWQQRVYEDCLKKIEAGLFVDQRWMDLAPSLFDKVTILRDPGYDVAYWNLHERNLKLSVKNLRSTRVNGTKLYFYHFSGFDPENPVIVSKHQSRFSYKTVGAVKLLYETYKQLLLDAGYLKTHKLPYSFARFDNGIKISDSIRSIYHSFDQERRDGFGNPFVTSGNSFYKWLISSGNLKIPKLYEELLKKNPEMKTLFPNINSDNRGELFSWMKYRGMYKYSLDKKLIEIISQKYEKNADNALTVVKDKFYSFVYSVYAKPYFQKNKMRLKQMVGDTSYYQIRNFIRLRLSGKSNSAVKQKSFIEVQKQGLNISGHISAESGTGEAVRSMVRSCQSINIPIALINYEENVYRKNDASVKNYSDKTPFDINLVHVNADQTDIFFKSKSPEFYKNKYNIGYWFWEQSEFPGIWQDRFKYCNEIWTASSFTADAISKKSPIPVLRVPLSIDQPLVNKFNRSHFGISGNDFVFLFIFDFLSVFERKNPLAVIEAFQKSFGTSDNACLVIKSVNGKYDPINFKRLKKYASGKIRILEGYMSRDEVNGLIGVCDSYVSLHRSEGFGLTIAEAMIRKKPVIATAYSANMEIMTIANSLPVQFEVDTLDKDYGPYKKGTVWAKPSVEHASSCMKRVYQDRKFGQTLGEKAANDVSAVLNKETIGRIIKERISVIRNGN